MRREPLELNIPNGGKESSQLNCIHCESHVDSQTGFFIVVGHGLGINYTTSSRMLQVILACSWWVYFCFLFLKTTIVLLAVK